MWTISDKQMASMAESLAKVANRVAEKVIEKAVNIANATGKDETQNSSLNDAAQLQQLSNNTDNNIDKGTAIPSKKTKNSSNKQNDSSVTNTTQTTNLVMPCEQVEVVSINSEPLNANNKEFTVLIDYYEDGEQNENKEINNQIVAIDVFSIVKFRAQYSNKKNIEDDKIEWFIEYGSNKKIQLGQLNEIIGNSKTKKISGSEIYFPIPKEWGQRTIKLIALRKDMNLEKTVQLKIKDHIVAAFFRLETEVKTEMVLPVSQKEKGTPIGILFHNQGLYKEGNTFYTSVSTKPSTPSYIYQSGGGNKEVIRLDRDEQMKEFTHPGGLQIAGNVLAIGLEQYTGIPLSTNENSIICFFDVANNIEYEHLRIEQTKKKGNPNRASALGIIEKGDKYIVANRGGNLKMHKMDFHIIDEISNALKERTRTPIASFPNVGDFQNINLFFDEKEELYLFGMGIEGREGLRDTNVYQVFDARSSLPNNNHDINRDLEQTGYFNDGKGWAINPSKNHRDFNRLLATISEKEYPGDFCTLESLTIPYFDGKYLKHRVGQGTPVKDVVVYKYPLKVPTPESQNICRIFKVNNADTKNSTIDAVWIGEDGLLKNQLYNQEGANNFLKFNCAISQSFIPDTDPSFHWASCLHLNIPKTKPNKGEQPVFKGKFTLYAVGAGVENKKIKAIGFEEKENNR